MYLLDATQNLARNSTRRIYVVSDVCAQGNTNSSVKSSGALIDAYLDVAQKQTLFMQRC